MVQSNLKKISAVIPAYNEEKNIFDVINRTKEYVDEVIVVDDCSSDNTATVALKARARVLSNKKKTGYVESIKRGFRGAIGDIIITLDADGEHNPEEIPYLLRPILNYKADLVLGKREKIARISERFLNWLTNFKVKVEDSGTGFRTIKKDLALKLNLKGKCTCGIFVLESASNGAKIAEVPVSINSIDKKREIAWHHFLQFFYIFNWITSSKKSKFKQNVKN